MLICSKCGETIGENYQYMMINGAVFCEDCTEEMEEYACLYSEPVMCTDCGEAVKDTFYRLSDGTCHCVDCVTLTEYDPQGDYWENMVNELREECFAWSY